MARMGVSGRPAEGNRTEVKRVETERGAGHPECFCPNCSAELKESGCKLSCPRCGFYFELLGFLLSVKSFAAEWGKVSR